MADKSIYKKPFQLTTGADILAILKSLNKDELKNPIVICINGEVFDPEHTMIEDKKIEVGSVTYKENGEHKTVIGNIQKLTHNQQYTVNYLNKT